MASKLYVGGLSYSTTSDSLRACFEPYGSVQSAEVITDRFSGQSRGFGFVEMSTEAEAKAAISALDGKDLDGRRIKVQISQPQGSGGGGRSGGGNRGGGGGFGGPRARTSRW